jgi:hypothetical protein
MEATTTPACGPVSYASEHAFRHDTRIPLASSFSPLLLLTSCTFWFYYLLFVGIPFILVTAAFSAALLRRIVYDAEKRVQTQKILQEMFEQANRIECNPYECRSSNHIVVLA